MLFVITWSPKLNPKHLHDVQETGGHQQALVKEHKLELQEHLPFMMPDVQAGVQRVQPQLIREPRATYIS